MKGRKRPDFSRFSGLLALVVLIGVGGAPAVQAGDVYTIERLPVDATGPSAAEAREIALAKGRTEALQKVFRRLAPQSYWGSLPQFSEAEAMGMVAGLQVAGEKTSATRYLAEVTYSFKPARIRAAFRAAQIPYSETQARVAVLLPVLETPDGGVYLWEPENIWAEAWRNRVLGNELVPLLSPLGELEDLVSVTIEDAVGGNWEALGPFAARYGVDHVMLAYALVDEEDNALIVRMIRLTGAPRMPSETADQFSLTVNNWNGLPLEALVETAIDQVVLRLNENWKRQTIVRSDAVPDLLRTAVRFSDFDEWLAIRERLETTPMVRGFDVLSISRNGAELMLHFLGTFDQLRISLAQQDLSLFDSGIVTMLALTRPGAPGEEVQAPRAPGGSPAPGAPAERAQTPDPPFDGVQDDGVFETSDAPVVNEGDDF